jgi:hypothetical protein
MNEDNDREIRDGLIRKDERPYLSFAGYMLQNNYCVTSSTHLRIVEELMRYDSSFMIHTRYGTLEIQPD